jgi:hypothetical protein
MGGGGNPPGILIRKGNHFVRPSGKKAHLGLDQAARMWPTPMASDGVKPSAGNRRNSDLTHQAKDWTVDCRPSHPAPTTGTGGETTSASGLRLNPAFVEALMGWPAGWTGFDSVATEWCRWLRRMRGELLNADLSMLEADTE